MDAPGDSSAQPPERSPNSFDRRKLLIVAGFGAANVFALNKLGAGKLLGSTSKPPTATVKEEQAVPTGPPALDGAVQAPPGHVFDRVITNGRVLDPETGYDQIANVGIDGDTITSISTEALTGRSSLDAAGLVVAPGFIDILSYEPNPYGVWYKVADGVTSNLAMHGINDTADGFFQMYGAESQRPPVHYGGAFDNPHMRSVVLKLPTKAATASQRGELERAFESGIASGWLGLDVEPEYSPWVDADEIMGLSRVAAKYKLPVFSHIRFSSPRPPEASSLLAIDELLKVAEETGAAVHVDHITSMATHLMPEAIAKIDAARASGLDVTACLYPYDFWATTTGSERFSDGWQERFGITYGDLEIAGTGERLTESSFAKARRNNTLVAAHAIPHADVELALKTPWIMLGSDAILEESHNNHPRSTGCFTRLLGRYVREGGVLSLRDALSKMTILPAKRLELGAPALRRKGRLQIGADADITVFDPATVIDRSTIQDPAQEAVGVHHVLVMGQVVRQNGTNDTSVRPGLPIKSEIV